MSETISLVPLKCVQCSTPIPANPDEIAWACPQCGTGLLLDEEQGLKEFEIHYAENIKPTDKGHPCWVAQGKVEISRSTYGAFGKKDKEAQAFWAQPRLFFIPAFKADLDQIIMFGSIYLKQPPELAPGSPAPFLPVIQRKADLRALAEFIVIGTEAERRDDIKKINFSLELSEPALWVLP